MRPRREAGSTSRLTRSIAALFLIGVTVGVLLEVIGMVLHFLSSGQFGISFDAPFYIHAKNLGLFALDIWGMEKGRSIDIFIMTLGILVLILTPYLRVVISIVYFAWERDYKYVLLTLFVLVVLSLSLALH
jgi:uncharacterized membrane protein